MTTTKDERKDACDLRARYRPVALRAVVAAFSVRGQSAEVRERNSERSVWDPDVYGEQVS